MQTATEEQIYCGSCGAANKKSAVTCCECEKKLNKKGSPLLDFLKDHIKDSLQDKVTDSVFSVIKNFLLSHLYGAVLALCVIATVCMSVYASLPPKGVSAVRQHPQEAAQQAGEGDAQQELDREVLAEEFGILMDSYDIHVDSLSGGPGIAPEALRTPDDLFAQPHLPAYASAAAHDFLNSEFYALRLPKSDIGYQGSVPLLYDTLRFGKDCQTDLGKRLNADGYTVAEINAAAFWTPNADREGTPEELIADAVFLEEYLFTFVEVDGVWYIASDVRL